MPNAMITDDHLELKRFGLLLGSAPIMDTLYRQIDKVAGTDATVLLVGESGTGKELVAQTIHQKSRRCQQPFITVNCGAIPPQLIEAALFGHEKGSFTGAQRQHIGYFEQAADGTLFLDEITEMPLNMQVRLLRVLECGRFMRVGGEREVCVNFRLLAATNRDLAAAVEHGKLREDLMYRLAVFPMRVPPLRERGEDIVLLARHFLELLNDKEHSNKEFSPASLELARRYAWPGNVRELKNMVQRAFILAGGSLNLEECLSEAATHEPGLRSGHLNFPAGMPLASAQREIILATLKHFGGDKRQTANTLGISLKTLYNRLKEY